MERVLPELPPRMDGGSIEDVQQEIAALRRWCGQIFMEVKETNVKSGEFHVSLEQVFARLGELEKSYIEMSNELTSRVSEIEEVLNNL